MLTQLLDDKNRIEPQRLTPTERATFGDFKKKILHTKSQIYCNMAACQLANDNYSMVIKNCTNCLNIDKQNVKAYYRRAQAYENLNEYETAIEDLNEALNIDKESQHLKDKIAHIKQLDKKYRQQMGSNLKKMFN
jgi:tetratricopeptide (TPR) repeat protein